MATLIDPYNFLPVRAHRAAEGGRRMAGTFRTSRSSTTVNLQDGRTLEEIAQDQVRNYPLAESFLSGWTVHTAGTGIWPDFAASSKEERRALRHWFLRWNKRADADSMTTLHGMTGLVARKVAEDGEVFARLRFRRPEDGLATPLQIQLICSAQLSRHKTDGAVGNNHVIGGIERDRLGRRVAYHFYREHPGDISVTNRSVSGETVRIPAEQVLHMGLPQAPGELRHVSILRSALMTLKGIWDTNENTMERLRVLSLFTALFSLPLDETNQPRFMGAQDPNAQGVALSYDLEAGMLNEVPPGATITQLETPDVGSTYLDFMRNQTQNVAAMMGLTYSELSGNYNDITLSSLRAGIVGARRRHTFFQQHVLIDQWLAPVVSAGIQAAVLAGTLNLSGYLTDPEEYDDILWRPQREEYIDPLKDSQADINRVDNLQAALSDVQNGDPEQVARRIIEDRELYANLPPDPRQPRAEPLVDDDDDDDDDDE